MYKILNKHGNVANTYVFNALCTHFMRNKHPIRPSVFGCKNLSEDCIQCIFMLLQENNKIEKKIDLFS